MPEAPWRDGKAGMADIFQTCPEFLYRRRERPQPVLAGLTYPPNNTKKYASRGLRSVVSEGATARGDLRFLLVDAILEWELGKRARGIKNVSLSEDFFDDHFPLKPIMPGVLVVEGMAQLSGLLLEESMKVKGVTIKALMSLLDKAKFRQPVYPGSQLEYVCEIRQMNEFGGKVAAVASVGGTVCAECGLLFSFHEFGNPTQNAVRERILDTWLTNAKRLP